MTSSTICSHHRIRTVLLMCVVLLSVSLHAQAQNKETRINLNIRNATLESFVKQLENATGFSFIYGEEVKLTHRITLEMKQKNISEILQRAFENEPITFEISGKHILLHKRPVPQKPVSRKFTISGYVTDGASSETLIGANILESRRSTGTATNPFGFYSLTLPEGETASATVSAVQLPAGTLGAFLAGGNLYACTQDTLYVYSSTGKQTNAVALPRTVDRAQKLSETHLLLTGGNGLYVAALR